MTRIGYRQARIIAYLLSNPGATCAEIDRATNTHVPHAHHVTYDAVKRLVRRGIVRGIRPDDGIAPAKNGSALVVAEGGS